MALGYLAGGALERGHDAGRGLVGHPRLRPGRGDGQGARRVGHGHREAAHADFLLAFVDGVPLLADHLKVGEQQVRVGDRGRRVGGHAVPLEQRAGLAGRQLGQQGLADRGAVRADPAARLGEHPHRVRAGHLREVDDLVAVEHGQVGRLAGEPDQLGQVRPQRRAEHAAGGLAEPDQPCAQRVPPRRLLPDVAPVDQRAYQPVHGGQREPGDRGEFGQAERPAGVGQHLEQVEGPLDGLHAARRSGGGAPGCLLTDSVMPGCVVTGHRQPGVLGRIVHVFHDTENIIHITEAPGTSE